MVSGFAHAPLSKAFTSLSALCIAALDIKPFIRFQFVPHITEYAQYWQALLYHIAFPSSDRHVLCVVVLYFGGAAVERRLGSRRYAVFLISAALLHSLFSLVWGACVAMLPAIAPEYIRSGFLPGGPYGVLAALAYEYYVANPPLWSVRVGALEFTDRVLIAIPVLLLALAEAPNSLVSVVLGFAAARVYHMRLGNFSLSKLDVSAGVAHRFQSLLPLVGSLQLPTRTSRAEYI
ncbi:hypothetical protein MCUN1_001207 [Malassezia cuniculi]|uniref:Derlin n=1 Tax=Malassezia cuniculi TaxID=948313 RepID=A0AAF0EPC3_9BASI|nr:hypothetical protein MCUN1_001207 [Malassezia cuniculi]